MIGRHLQEKEEPERLELLREERKKKLVIFYSVFSFLDMDGKNYFFLDCK